MDLASSIGCFILGELCVELCLGNVIVQASSIGQYLMLDRCSSRYYRGHL